MDGFSNATEAFFASPGDFIRVNPATVSAMISGYRAGDLLGPAPAVALDAGRFLEK